MYGKIIIQWNSLSISLKKISDMSEVVNKYLSLKVGSVCKTHEKLILSSLFKNCMHFQLLKCTCK